MFGDFSQFDIMLGNFIERYAILGDFILLWATLQNVWHIYQKKIVARGLYDRLVYHMFSM